MIVVTTIKGTQSVNELFYTTVLFKLKLFILGALNAYNTL